MSDKIIRFVKYWAISVAVLFLPYCGLYILGFTPIGLGRFFAGVAVVGMAFGLLLLIDSQTETQSEAKQKWTAWELIYELFVQRKSLFVVYTLALAGIAIGTYKVSISLFKVEYDPDSAAVEIRLPGETQYYTLISPYGEGNKVGGWQNTKIYLELIRK